MGDVTGTQGSATARTVVAFERVESRDTAEAAVLELVNSIRRTELRTGDRLPNLPELSASLGIARDNVRRALIILSSAGVVETRVGRNGGTLLRDRAGIPAALAAVIAESTAPDDDWEDLVAARRLLQPEAARLVAQQADPETLKRIHAHLDELLFHVGRGDLEHGLYAATELNCVIALRCGNRVIADMLIRTIDRISVIGVRSVKRLEKSAELIAQIVDTQKRLVAAIEADDYAAIVAAVEDQMAVTLREAAASRHQGDKQKSVLR